eukprot:7981137-Alexandrium_andersonii.AAC.1
MALTGLAPAMHFGEGPLWGGSGQLRQNSLRWQHPPEGVADALQILRPKAQWYNMRVPGALSCRLAAELM